MWMILVVVTHLKELQTPFMLFNTCSIFLALTPLLRKIVLLPPLWFFWAFSSTLWPWPCPSLKRNSQSSCSLFSISPMPITLPGTPCNHSLAWCLMSPLVCVRPGFSWQLCSMVYVAFLAMPHCSSLMTYELTWSGGCTSFQSTMASPSFHPSFHDPQIVVTDACCTGGGGHFGYTCFHVDFPPHLITDSAYDINVKEILTVIVALRLWGSQLHGSRILIRSDNTTTVQSLNTRQSHSPLIQQCLRVLWFLCASHDLDITAQHIPGYLNDLADLLSHWSIDKQAREKFFALPDAHKYIFRDCPAHVFDLSFDPSVSPWIFHHHFHTCLFPFFTAPASGAHWIQKLLHDTYTTLHAAYAPGSLNNMQSHIRSYLLFCISIGHPHQQLSIPVLCNYLVFLSRSLAYGSIKNHLSSLCYFYELLSIRTDLYNDFYIHLTLHGLQRQIGNSPQAKLSITPQILRHLHSTIDFASSLDVAFWTACLVAFFTFLRKSNLLPASATSFDPDHNLTPSDVQIFSSFALITVNWTKTIQFQRKSSLCLFHAYLVASCVLCLCFNITSTKFHILVLAHTTLLIPVRATISHSYISSVPPSSTKIVHPWLQTLRLFWP